LTKSATATMFTSVWFFFGRPPVSSSSNSVLSQNREYNLKTFDRFRASFRKRFAPILVFVSQIDRLWNKILWQLSVHFHLPWRIKKADFTRQVITRTVEDKQTKLCMWTDVDW
jgi:hypothetical protein